jgi:UDP-N-acetylglucosamine transferase subunit ALG13
MIFVILGTQKFQLNRLLKKLDKYVEEGKIKDDIVAQIGYSDYLPKRYKYVEFLDKKDFDTMIRKADIVIAHSGVGSIISALSADKPVVVFPRLAKYKEHIDDHQLDIAHAFSHKNYCLCCEENDDLLEKINQCREMQFDKYVSQRERIVGIITNYLVKC